MPRSGGEKKMTRTTRKTVCFIVIMLFVAGVITFFAFATSGFKNWNANTWFNSEPAKVSAPAKEDPSEPNDRGEEPEQETVPDENEAEPAVVMALTSATASSNYLESITFDSLPEGCYAVPSSGNIGGKVLVIDYPNLSLSPDSLPSLSVMSGLLNFCFNGTDFGLGPNPVGSSIPSLTYVILEGYTNSVNYENKPVTGYILPSGMYVASADMKNNPFYLLDEAPETPETPTTPTTPLYTITNENPYPDKTFDDGAEIYPGGTYEGGYVVLNKSGISSFLSGTTQATLFGDTEHSIEFYRTDRILYLSDPEHSTMVQRRAIQTGSETGYVYIRMDLGNVCNVYSADLMSQSVRYLTEAEEPDNPSPYITV